MRISVILISAGVSEWDIYTVKALESLKRFQRFPDVEYIVADNGGCERGDINTPSMLPYAEIVNRTAAAATGERLLILNNDIVAQGGWCHWIQDFRQVPYCGPQILIKEQIAYVEGWCISIDRDLWHMIGGFNTIFKNSWEDVDLAWRLGRLGVYPSQMAIPFHHVWGGTRNRYPGSNQWDQANYIYLLERKRQARHAWSKQPWQ